MSDGGRGKEGGRGGGEGERRKDEGEKIGNELIEKGSVSEI